jgi:tetratricopeptide (TPR) repeat protein
MPLAKAVIVRRCLIAIAFVSAAQLPLRAAYADAVKLFQDKDYGGALKILAQDLNPAEDFTSGSPNYDIRFLAAHCHWKLGNGQSVIAHFQKCMQIKKDSVDPYIDLAFYAYETRDYSFAENTASRGLKISGNALLYYIIGKVSLSRKDFWRAKALFEKANAIDPEISASYNALGITLMNLNKPGEANTAFSVAFALEPQSAEILNNLARSCQAQGDAAKAREYIEKARQIDSSNAVIGANHQSIMAGAKSAE